MTIEELKCELMYTPAQITKHILNDNGLCGSGNKYVAWLSYFEDEVLYRVWAYNTTKTYGKRYREVMRAILGQEGLIYRDMYLNYMGGYKVVYKPSRGESSNWYGYSYYVYDESDFGKWQWSKEIGVAVEILNLDMLKETKFKYSGWNGKGGFLKWMETYAEHPEVELLGKLGYPPSKKLLKKASKDKAFCKFLAKQNPDGNLNAICYAYDHNMSVHDAGIYLTKSQELGRELHGRKEYLKKAKIDFIKALDYVKSQKNCGIFSYCDYIDACLNLKLDMSDTKNAFPKDFKRMHDLRINQWEVKKDGPKNKEFKKAAVKYLQYSFQGKKYSIVIPKTRKELIAEGTALNHCVGKMGYDNKMIKGDTFIAFVRKNEALKDPFVTVEYGIKEKKVLQCYGEWDSKPEKEVIDFVRTWSKRVKNAI